LQPVWRRAYARSSRSSGGKLGVERVDHFKPDRHLLARGRRQRRLLEPLAPGRGQQVQTTPLRKAVVIENGVDPLLPLAAIVDQRVPEPDTGAEIKQMIGRDPALRQPAGHHQLPQVLGIGAVGLRVLLVAAQRTGLRRLREMHPRPHPPQLLDHEPPPGRRLKRHLELLAAEPRQEPTHRLPMRRRHS
jgi:hypothetical protein